METPTAQSPEVSATTWMTFSGWMTGPVAASLGLLLGVIGVALAVYFYLKQKRERVPVYLMSTSVIISDESNRRVEAPDKLEVLWNKKPIRQLTVSTVVLGNAGNETIRGSDLPDGQPTLLELSNGEILDYSVLESSAPGLDPTLDSTDRRKLRVRFAYLDRGDAISVRIVHTGEPAKIVVSGHVIGAGGWRKAVDRTPRQFLHSVFNILCAMIIFAVFPPLTQYLNSGLICLMVAMIAGVSVYMQFSVERFWGRFGEPAKLKLRIK